MRGLPYFSLAHILQTSHFDLLCGSIRGSTLINGLTMAPISASSFDILLPTIFLSQLEYMSIQAGQLATWLVYLPKFPFRFLKRFNHEPGFHSNHFRPTRGVFLMRYHMGNACVRLLLHNMGYIHQSTLLFFFWCLLL